MKFLICIFLIACSTLAFALPEPCAMYTWSDDPTYTVSGHVKYSYRTPETWEETAKTFIHFSNDHEVCFSEGLSPDDVKSGQDVTYTYHRHCDKSCFTFVKSEEKK